MNDTNQISIEKVKKWFEKISRGKASYGKEGIKPRNDWNILIIVAAVIFCLEAVSAFFIYFQIENNIWFQEPNNTGLTEVSINQNLLQKISGQIDERDAIYNATSTVKSVADPSL